jgi:acetolactate synthase-1/2/3 large subunit
VAGIRVFLDVYTTRLEHGAGLPEFPRLGFYPWQALRQLDGITHLITAGTRAPVAFFAYLDQPTLLTPDGAANLTLADVHEDAVTALADLADLIAPTVKPQVNAPLRPELPAGPLTLESWPQVIGALLPEDAIICDESISSGAGLLAAIAGAPRHDVLSQMGVAMGAGLPLAIGAAIAAPERPVIALVGDGCAMYTISALWSHAREDLDITTVILKNSSYGILREEWTLLREPGQGELHDSPLINLTGAPIDFVGLARSMGVPGAHADTAEEFAAHLRRALNEPGPHLIEIVVPAIV